MKSKLFIIVVFILCAAAVQVHAVEIEGIDIHGFISQGYLFSDKNNYLANSEKGSFQFNELGINFSKDMTENLRIGMQFFSRDLGETGNNAVEVDWAFGDYHWQDWLGFRAGLMKMPHGFHNETRDIDMLRTWILLPQSVYNEITRDYYTRLWGIGAYGEIDLKSSGSLSYRALIGTYVPNPDNSGLIQNIQDGSSFPLEVTDFDNGIQYSGSLQWRSPFKGFRFGITTYKQNAFHATIKNLVQLNRFIPAGLAWQIDLENLATVLSAEYIQQKLTLAAGYRYRENSYYVYLLSPEISWKSESYYLSAAYRFTDFFEIGSYYSIAYPDKDDKDGERFKAKGQPDFRAWQKDFSVTVRFDFNQYWLFKIEGHLMNGVGDLFIQENPNGFEKNWYLLAAKVTFNF